MVVRKPSLPSAIMIFYLCSSISAFADDRYDEYPLDERFKIRVGVFFINRFDTTVRFDSTQFPIGTLIDLEDNFNVDSHETVSRIDGFFRFDKRHRIEWTYYRSRRDGVAVASQEFVIGDPDDPEGGFIIPKDARIQTHWNYDLFKVGYAWSFLNKRHYEMYLGGGFNIRQLDVEIDYSASLGTTNEHDSYSFDGIVPLPTGALGGRWNITAKWQVNFGYELFLLDLGKYRGSQQEFQLLFEHRTFKYVGFGIGFNAVNLNVRADVDEVRGEFDSRMLGMLGYIKAYY